MSAVTKRPTNKSLKGKGEIIRYIEKGKANIEASEIILSAKKCCFNVDEKQKDFSLYCKKLHHQTKNYVAVSYLQRIRQGRAVWDWFILQISQQLPIDGTLIKKGTFARRKS